MAIFTILILPIHEHERYFHLLRSSSISFFRDLKFLSYRSLTSLVRVTPRYFILLAAMVKDLEQGNTPPLLIGIQTLKKDLFIHLLYVSTLWLSSDTPEEVIWSHYGWLWATMWLLLFELRTSGRAFSALNCWAISPAPDRKSVV